LAVSWGGVCAVSWSGSIVSWGSSVVGWSSVVSWGSDGIAGWSGVRLDDGWGGIGGFRSGIFSEFLDRFVILG
jgi:hypothetical protein